MNLLPKIAALALLPLCLSFDPPPLVVSHVVKLGHNLPAAPFDVETVTIEPWGLCELQQQRTFETDATGSLFPLPHAVPWESRTKYRVAIRDGLTAPPASDDLFVFAETFHAGTITLDQPSQSWTFGPWADDLAQGVAPTVIRDDARCDRFEGAPGDEIELHWGSVTWTSFIGAAGVDFDFAGAGLGYQQRTVDVGVRVTYTSK